MRVRLLFFATLKDIAGSRELQLEVPAGSTVGDVWSELERTYPRMESYRSIVLAALNEEYVDRGASIADGDELALFPPVSGGAA
jgi:molybdopterin synthase catalytic subunit